MISIVGLVVFDIVTLVMLGIYIAERNAANARQFLCMLAGCLTMTAGRLLDPVLGWGALAVIVAGLLMILAGRYWGGEKRTPLWLDRVVQWLYRFVPERR